MIKYLLTRWFNLPPEKDIPFLEDKIGRKFWVFVPDEDLPYRISLGYRGKPAGYAYLLWRNGHVELSDIIVFKQYRHQGLGSAFFRFLFEIAREKGARFIHGRMQPEEGHTMQELAAWYHKQGAEVNLEKHRFILYT